MSEYGIKFADWCEFPPETMVGETVFDGEGNAIGWVTSATEGRSCASCPETDNPDSYISHIQSALKWHDEHVPRPTNPRNTCVVLKGQNPPEEVLFVHDDGGVTHYQPEDAGTCHGEIDSDYFECKLTTFKCRSCGWSGIIDNGYAGDSFDGTDMPRHCPNCGKRIKEEAE